jgi:hypothetical protein
MKRGVQIARWLKQVKADHRLCTVDFTVAYQLSERTNEAEFARSGILLTWQGIALLAAEAGVCERTVQRSVGRLQKFKHLAIKPGGGRHHSNRYTLLLHATQAVAAIDDNSETVTAVSGFSGNGDSGVGVSPETVTVVSGKGDSRVAKPRQPCHPNFYRTTDRTLATISETEPGGPRSRADALGPHPLGELEPELRSRLGENFKLLSMARLVARTDETVTLSVLTVWQGDNIRQHCEADILAAAGVTELRFEFAIAPEPPPLRRMP